jgi:hypothetical protein
MEENKLPVNPDELASAIGVGSTPEGAPTAVTLAEEAVAKDENPETENQTETTPDPQENPPTAEKTTTVVGTNYKL